VKIGCAADYRSSLRWGLRLLFLLLPLAVHSQTGNEWIEWNQQYWKMPIAEDGLYRISYETLQESGFPVSGSNPQLIQLFSREKQLRVNVAGESDGSFDPGDYIEFYGLKNSGWLDSLTYSSSNAISNPYFSLFNDTSMVFITLGNSPGLRTPVEQYTDFSGFTPSSYAWFQPYREYHDEYLQGRLDPNGIGLPSYGAAEGWMSQRFSVSYSFQTDLPTPNAYSAPDAPPTLVRALSAGASLANISPNHHLQVGWGNSFNVAIDTIYYGYQRNDLQFIIPPNQLGSSFTRITHRGVDDLGAAVDNHAVAWVSLRYPHTWQLNDYVEGDLIAVEDEDGDGWIYIEATNLSIVDPRFFISGNGFYREVVPVNEGNVWKCLLPVSDLSGNARIRILSASSFGTVSELSRVTNTGFFTDYLTTELDSAFVIITHPSLWNAATSYAAYRQQNGMEVLLANVEELYLQYGGGIPKHPLAISRFCKDMIDAWPEDPGHLFFIGKSIHEMTISANQGARLNPEIYARNLVPTWGWPPSDAMFTARLNAPLYHSAIPTGRLSAETPQEVMEYLSKVIQLESQPPARWQKNILHFGGGGNAFEQNLFKGYLENYKNIAQDTSYAARVYTFLKNTTDPIQMNLSDSIQILLNEGAAVMTFFGHASSTGFDQNLDAPQNYSNQGKYPLLIGNSCYTGNIHLSEAQSTSEQFVLVPDRGVIGFLAKGDLGIPLYLDLYTNQFYRNLFQDNYGKTIGQCMRESVLDFQQVGDFYRENVALTFGLHGDPSVRLYPRPLPDYDVKLSDIRFNPSRITAQVDSFRVKVEVFNLGKAIDQPVGVELIRHYPDGTDSSYVQSIEHIFNRDSVVFTLPIDPLRGVGQNTFDVFVDYPSSLVDEMDNVGNNVVMGVPLFISSGDLIPVYPFEFAVVPVNQITLKASTGYVLEAERNYVIQIDTTDTFNSPWMSEHQVIQSGGVVEWNLPLSLLDSTVYFWRCSADSTDVENGFRWRESSFQFIDGISGWGQDHFFQFEEDARAGLEYDRTSRGWSFSPLEAQLRCEVYGDPSTTFEALGTRFLLDLDVQDYSGPGSTPAVVVAVMDSTTLQPWESNFNGSHPGNDFGNSMVGANARNRSEKYFIFEQNDPAQLAGLTDMLNNRIPDGHYVLLYTWRYATYDSWTDLAPELFDAMTSLGSQNIGQGLDSVPFIYFIKKGFPDTRQEVTGVLPESDITLEAPLIGSSDQGVLRSPLIGASTFWAQVNWDFDSQEANGEDEVEVKIIGVGQAGNEVVLNTYPEIPGEVNDVSVFADPTIFPHLRLEARLADPLNATPNQIDRWHVVYDPVPECALDPVSGYYLSSTTPVEGEDMSMAMAIRNISPRNMDSLLVRYWIEDADRVMHPIVYARQAPLNSGAILLDTISFSTTGLSGSNTLFMEVNPPSTAVGGYDQPEQYHFNNIAQIPFEVSGDRTNPMLDVTFDGMHILNRDIVSAEPDIVVLLDDENEFLLLNEAADTALFRLFITEPGLPSRPIYFSQPEVTWLPADSERNRSRIEFHPRFMRDGVHTLIVQAQDKSGNASGRSDYKIDFEVIGRPTITEVLNYPNPFSTSTRFVFTLTGSEVPDQMKIQIMTIGGRVVREITQDELGLMRIGRNLTDYSWNGTDEFGDPLANGVYLYRVVARLNGQDLEVRSSGASSFITKGFGKMYLMR